MIHEQLTNTVWRGQPLEGADPARLHVQPEAFLRYIGKGRQKKLVKACTVTSS